MPENKKLISSDDYHATYECTTKTGKDENARECITTYTVLKDLETFKELATQEDYESYCEIKKIRAQDADRRAMQEDDPKKQALKQLRAKLKDMSEDDINALLESIQ